MTWLSVCVLLKLGLTTFTHQIGGTALLAAAHRGHLPVVEFLLTKGTNLEAEYEVSVWRRAAGTDALTRI